MLARCLKAGYLLWKTHTSPTTLMACGGCGPAACSLCLAASFQFSFSCSIGPVSKQMPTLFFWCLSFLLLLGEEESRGERVSAHFPPIRSLQTLVCTPSPPPTNPTCNHHMQLGSVKVGPRTVTCLSSSCRERPRGALWGSCHCSVWGWGWEGAVSLVSLGWLHVGQAGGGAFVCRFLLK